MQFNQQFIVGQKDIRGYTQGEYRGNYLLAIQGEYRWNLYDRWSAVGFFGLATVFESVIPGIMDRFYRGLVLAFAIPLLPKII